MRDDLKVICDVTSPGSENFRGCILLARFFTYFPEVQKGVGSGQFLWNVFSKFCTALWARNATIETDWHVVKPGHCARLVDREGAVFFRVCWIFSTPLILAPQHSIIFVGLSPGFHPSVAVLTSASSILAFKWSKGLASNSLHAKFATT